MMRLAGVKAEDELVDAEAAEKDRADARSDLLLLASA